MLQSNRVKAEWKHYFHGMLTEEAVIVPWLFTQESQMITNETKLVNNVTI